MDSDIICYTIIFIGIIIFIIIIAYLLGPKKNVIYNSSIGHQDSTIIDEDYLDDEEIMKIIKTRYAKGEITKFEYEQLKKDLE